MVYKEYQEQSVFQMLDLRRTQRILNCWSRLVPKLREENFFENRKEKHMVHYFRLRKLGQLAFLGWADAIRVEKKEKMIEKDKTQYLNKVSDWLKEYEAQKQN